MSRKFDRFMVATDNGRNLKLSKLTDAEFRALVQGIWPIASIANPRGAFMVGNQPATADDVVFMAPKVSKRAATSCIEKLRALGMLEHDEEIGGEWVHDWDLVNPAPKADRTNAERQARYRAKNAERNATGNAVTDGPVTPPEVRRGSRNNPPSPPRGERPGNALNLGDTPPPPVPSSGRKRDQDDYEQTLAAWSGLAVPEASEHYRLAGARHALSVIDGQRKQPTLRGVRWLAGHGQVNAFGLDDEQRAAIRREFITAHDSSEVA